MKRFALLTLILVLTLALALPSAATAQVTRAVWTSMIVYANPSSQGGSLQIMYYASGGGTAQAEQPVDPYASGELFIGSVSAIGEEFSGSAVISASVPVVAVYRQFAAGSGTDAAYSPVLYTASDQTQTSPNYFIPSFIRSASAFTQVGIQNVETFNVTLTLDFYSASGTKTTFALPGTVASQSSKIISYADLPGFPALFDGSLVIRAVKSDDVNTGGRIVATAQELQFTGRKAVAFEGANTGANQSYLANASCNWGKTYQTSAFYVQNAGAVKGTVFIEFRSASGSMITRFKAGTVEAGRRLLTNACKTARMAGKSGSAVIYATTNGLYNGPRVPVVVTGKVTSRDGLQTAFMGVPQGALRVSAPYVRWSPSSADESTYISIMNVGSAPANVQVKYYELTGAVDDVSESKATHSLLNIPVLGKRSTTPYMIPASLTDGAFNGSILVESDQPVIVIVRAQKSTSITGYKTLGEDYLGVPVLE